MKVIGLLFLVIGFSIQMHEYFNMLDRNKDFNERILKKPCSEKVYEILKANLLLPDSIESSRKTDWIEKRWKKRKMVALLNDAELVEFKELEALYSKAYNDQLQFNWKMCTGILLIVVGGMLFVFG